MQKEYEEYSLHAAIAQMEDIGWCPMPGCKSIANIERAENVGRCQHCEFLFCLDCRQGAHPYKRCSKNRIDLNELYQSEIKEIEQSNKENALKLTQLYLKYCTKPCPNPKCHVPITKDLSGCTHIQCTLCYTWMCWACGVVAKGQMHYKQSPECYSDENTILPLEVNELMIQKYLGLSEDPCINIKHCAPCPKCKSINSKKGTSNLLTCKNQECLELFCYICNKSISGAEHFVG